MFVGQHVMGGKNQARAQQSQKQKEKGLDPLPSEKLNVHYLFAFIVSHHVNQQPRQVLQVMKALSQFAAPGIFGGHPMSNGIINRHAHHPVVGNDQFNLHASRMQGRAQA
jgi:hypothetical protein